MSSSTTGLAAGTGKRGPVLSATASPSSTQHLHLFSTRPTVFYLWGTLKALDSLKAANDDQQSGIDIVRRALRAPARQIADNAGEDGAWIVGKLLESEEYSWGFNAATGEYQDLVKAGVIDPAKVVRTALQDAASVASLLITTEALVAELPKEEKAAPMPAMDF